MRNEKDPYQIATRSKCYMEMKGVMISQSQKNGFNDLISTRKKMEIVILVKYRNKMDIKIKK